MRDLRQLYRERAESNWLRFLAPPPPLIHNPSEPSDFPMGKWNLYVGGAGREVAGYVNLDLFAVPGVDVAADAGLLPFRDATFTRIECDAVLEHVASAEVVVAELVRTLAAGGYLHLVTPFCHPFHEYPKDYRRFTLDGLNQLIAPYNLELVAQGWRTGPTATLLVFAMEYVKCWGTSRWWRGAVHFVLGWLLFPLRYADLWLLKRPNAQKLGNHCFVWLRKPPQVGKPA